MGLILYGLRKFGEAVGGIAIACAIYLSLQILVAFWGSLRDSLPNPMKTVEQLRSELASKVEELEALQKELSSRFGNVVNFERRIQELERSRPQWVTIWPPGTHIAQRSKHDLELKSLRTAKAKAVQAHGEMLQRQRQLQQHINRLQQQIANTLATPAGRVASIIQTHWLAGVLFGVGIFFVPMLTRAGWFYVVAPVASAAKPVRLANASQRLGPVPLPVLTCSSSTKKLDLTISPNESLFVRAAWLKSYDANTKKSTRPAWKLSSPFISYSAGLLAPTRVDGGSEGAKVSLWNGEDADRQLACVELRDHPGIVFKPKHLVGLIHEPGTLNLRKQWRLNHLHAWCTLQLRYIVLEGTGRAIFWGLGGIEALSPSGGKQCVNQDSVAGFDSRLAYSVRRNETFWPYLRGKEPLFDDCFEGNQQYLISVASEHAKGIIGVDTWLDRVLSIVGKVFGF